MPSHHVGDFHQPRPSPSSRLVMVLLFLGMALALAGNLYQYIRFEHMKRDVALMQKSTDRQIAKLTDAAAAELEENQQRFVAIKNQLEETAGANLRRTESGDRRASSQLQQRLEQKHQEPGSRNFPDSDMTRTK